MNCKKCGHELTENNITCPNCGDINDFYNGGGSVPASNEAVTPVTPEPLAEPFSESIEPTVETPKEEVNIPEPPVQEVNTFSELEKPNVEVETTPEAVVPEATVVPEQTVTPAAPDTQDVPNPGLASTPIQPVINSTSSEPIKKKSSKTGLVILIIVLLVLVVGAGAFFGYKFFTGKKNNNQITEPDVVPVEEEDNGDGKYVESKMFIDKMTDKEVFDLVHKSLVYDFEDGVYIEDLYDKLPSNTLGKKPFSHGYSDKEVYFGYIGNETAGKKRDYIDRITYKWKVTEEKTVDGESTYRIYKSNNPIQNKSAYLTMRIYTDRAEELYASMKKYYTELYPNSTVAEKATEDGVKNEFLLTVVSGYFVNVKYDTDGSVYHEFYVAEYEPQID